MGRALNNREIGLGVANPKSEQLESVEYIVAKAEKALQYYKPEDVFLNPDCGFGTFSGCALTTEKTAAAKMKRIVEAAKILRERYAARSAKHVGQAA